MKKFLLVILLIFNSVNFYGQNKELYFIEPQDGEKLTNPIRVKFGLSGFGVAPAGVLKENTGTPVVVNHYAKSALKNDCKVCVLTADDNLENTNKFLGLL